MDLARKWDSTQQNAEWFQSVQSGLLDAWLDLDAERPMSLDEIWEDLQHARAILERVEDPDLPYALSDFYCAAYRWHLACSSPSLASHIRHRRAASRAMNDVRELHDANINMRKRA